MLMLIGRTGKKVGQLMPLVLEYVANLTRPLFEDIDSVHYTQMSRQLNEGEEYAKRLLSNRYVDKIAGTIASVFVNDYPAHSFVVDKIEISKFHEKLCSLVPSLIYIKEPDDKIMELIDDLFDFLTNNRITAIGQLEVLK